MKVSAAGSDDWSCLEEVESAASAHTTVLPQDRTFGGETSKSATVELRRSSRPSNIRG